MADSQVMTTPLTEAEIRGVANSIGKPVRFGSETEEQAKTRRLKEYRLAGELLNQLLATNAGLVAQVAAAKDLVRQDMGLLGQRAERILELEDMLRRCLADWQNSPTWGNRELLIDAQKLLDEARA